jgi:hypothetical protein
MDADKTIYPTACDYLAIKRRIDDLICERSEIDAAIQDESHAAAQLAATIIRSMRAAGATIIAGDAACDLLVLMENRLETVRMTWATGVPLVAEDVFDRLPEIDPEPSLEQAIAEAQTHRTVWGDVMISPVTNINAGDFLDAFKTNLLNNWTQPTDAEIDAAAANGAIDEVFHADEEVE